MSGPQCSILSILYEHYTVYIALYCDCIVWFCIISIQVFFVPLADMILSCFKDDSIHAWESSNLEYKYQVPPPHGPTPHYRAFAVPQDGQLLVAGGRSFSLHVWTLLTPQLLHIIQLPPVVRAVKKLLFLPNCSDGGSSKVSQ